MISLPRMQDLRSSIGNIELIETKDIFHNKGPGVFRTVACMRGKEKLRKKGMATLSSIPAWRISWTEEPGGLTSMGSQRVRHD